MRELSEDAVRGTVLPGCCCQPQSLTAAVWCAGNVERSASEGNVVVIQGGSMLVNLTQPEAVATLNLMPLSCGVQQLPPLTLLDQQRAVVLDTLTLSVLVEPAAG